jgi:uncharacterized protein
MILDFTVLRDTYSIYRSDKNASIPHWIDKSDFCSITRTQDELSIVCKQSDITVNDTIIADRSWRIFKIKGPLDLSLVGILADIAELFKKNKIPIFAISTYDTDYILIKEQYLDVAITALKSNGHKVMIEK